MRNEARSMRHEAGGRILCFMFLASCFLFLSACATSFDARGRYHKVQHGETIWLIAKAYRVSVQDLAEINNVMDGGKIEPGRKLYIPQRPKGRMMKKLPKAEREKAFDAPIQTDHSKFIWPVNGTIFSNFGIRNGRRHDGIDIAVKSGTPIKAAADGEVAFSDRLSGYGNTVIIKHAGDFFTVYGHNQKNAVKKGQAVKKGSLIAYVGATGNATGSHCHFEIRNGQKARNPLFFLPVKH